MPPLKDVLRLVELRRNPNAPNTFMAERTNLSKAIIEQGVEDWLDELVAELAAREIPKPDPNTGSGFRDEVEKMHRGRYSPR